MAFISSFFNDIWRGLMGMSIEEYKKSGDKY